LPEIEFNIIIDYCLSLTQHSQSESRESVNCIEKFDRSIDVDLCDEEEEGEEAEGSLQRLARVIRLGLLSLC
jgi:hypothetical protein